jgi:hypothetical protein
VDIGADGVFADDALGADAILVKFAEGGTGITCLFNLPSDFSTCDAEYFQDYSNYNAGIWGIPVDAGALGLSGVDHVLSYSISACTGVYAGDIPVDVICDVVGDIIPATGTYGPTLDVTDPSLTFSTTVVKGFFGGPGGPVSVGVGSAGTDDDPSILVVFPNDHPEHQHAVVTTST